MEYQGLPMVPDAVGHLHWQYRRRDRHVPSAVHNACYNVQITSANNSDGLQENVKASLLTKTNFVIGTSDRERPSQWFAIGR
jgi:hypothetical protein